MEIMYSNKNYEIFDKKINCVYGDKIDLINMGYEFNGIEYDDEWIVKKFLDNHNLSGIDILEIYIQSEGFYEYFSFQRNRNQVS